MYTSNEEYIGKVITASTYTALSTDEVLFADTSSNSITITLPATGITRRLTITKTHADNTLTVDGNGANITGETDYDITVFGTSITLVWDGTNYFIS